MTGKNIDMTKGRVKEAAGALTGHRRLKNDGRVMREPTHLSLGR